MLFRWQVSQRAALPKFVTDLVVCKKLASDMVGCAVWAAGLPASMHAKICTRSNGVQKLLLNLEERAGWAAGLPASRCTRICIRPSVCNVMV
eukprot:1149364-Pelagomonas_calceolata.AAC.1